MQMAMGEIDMLERLVPSVPLYGYHLESIVGIRHAIGARGVKHGTTVCLVREPYNEYDSNAIRAERDNGTKIGYVSRDFAARLAPVMDRAEPWSEVTVACMALDTPDDYDVKVAVAYYGTTKEQMVGLKNHLKVRWIGLKEENGQKKVKDAFRSYQHALSEYKDAYENDMPFKSAFRMALETSKQKYWEARQGLPRLDGDGALDAAYQEAVEGKKYYELICYELIRINYILLCVGMFNLIAILCNRPTLDSWGSTIK